jgi:hypothetical protein
MYAWIIHIKKLVVGKEAFLKTFPAVEPETRTQNVGVT